MGGKCIKDSKPVSIVATNKASTMQIAGDDQNADNKSKLSGNDQVRKLLTSATK